MSDEPEPGDDLGDGGGMGPCPNCLHPEPFVIQDFARGDNICTNCGGVYPDRVLDYRSERRSIKDDNGKQKDHARTGQAANPLLNDSNLATYIAPVKGFDNSYANLIKMNERAATGSVDRSLLRAYDDINHVAARLALISRVTDRAKFLYKRVFDKERENDKSLKGRSSESLTAACLYMACRLEKMPRSVNELLGVTDLTKKEMNRAYKYVLNLLGDRVETVRPVDFIERWCSALNQPPQVVKIATYAATQCSQVVKTIEGQSPVSIAAACLYLAMHLGPVKCTIREVVEVAGVSEATIKLTYQKLYEFRTDLVPPELRTELRFDFLPAA